MFYIWNRNTEWKVTVGEPAKTVKYVGADNEFSCLKMATAIEPKRCNQILRSINHITNHEVTLFIIYWIDFVTQWNYCYKPTVVLVPVVSLLTGMCHFYVPTSHCTLLDSSSKFTWCVVCSQPEVKQGFCHCKLLFIRNWAISFVTVNFKSGGQITTAKRTQ